jgi:hypothetical protein
MTRAGLIAIVYALAFARVAHAQPSEADRCENNANARKDTWETRRHNWLANTTEIETRETALSWCRLWATMGKERIHKAEDFGRVLFTSDGFHPAVGVAAPNSGIGGGVAFDLSPASASRPLRFDTHAEYRISTSGSWGAGAIVNIRGAGRRSTETGHSYASLEVSHVTATQLPYFVEQPVGDPLQTRYRLEQTTARGTYHTPELGGASLFVETGVDAFSPGTTSGSDYASTAAVVVDAQTPGLTTSTTYGAFGGGLNWHYPLDERIAGYSTQFSASMRFFETSTPYSFRRADVTWAQQYTPGTDVDLGTFSTTARMITSTAQSGSRVPFYLQPTLGGNDIEHEAGLRSYEYDRFRANDIVAGEIEYTRTIYGPIAWLAFFDVGQAANTLSEFSTGQWHNSRGFGITFKAGNLAYFRAYLAWGGGFRTGATGDSNRMRLDGAQRGVF